MEKEILLEVRHLSIGFESYNAKVEKVIFNAISDLSLTVHKGEIVAIVGSSGSGKSLLAHAVMNILPDNARTGGTMFYKGELLTPERMNRLRGHEIAFIPQSVAFLDPLMQVGEQVVGTLGEKARTLQQKAFEHFGLKQSVAKLYPFQLSGGMARRVLLSTSPGLDLKIAIEALKDFRILADQGKGVILITHDIDLALHVADKIAIFYDGRVVETADTQTFRGDGQGLKHPYSRALFHALPQNGFNLQRCQKE